MHSRGFLLAAMLCWTPQLSAQVPPDLARDRAEYAAWLRSAPTSPFAAIALQRIGPGMTLGPAGSEIVLSGTGQFRVAESGGRITLDSGSVSRLLPRNRAVPLGSYRLLAAGPTGRATLLVFGTPHDVHSPDYFPYQRMAADTVTLVPPASRQAVLLMAPEGTEVEAEEAGSVTVAQFGAPVSLRVRRFPGASADESELEIYFRDATNGRGSYPAGRFVSLEPVGGGRYRLDFNRARNPFCAYSSVFPCPAPWAGNAIVERVEAGEKYQGTERTAGPWRATLDLSGGTLKFGIEVEVAGSTLTGKLCNGQQCDAFSSVQLVGDSVRFELADYAASITAAVHGDSLRGFYRNVGNRGPRVIPFRASRGRWPVSPAPAWLAGRWYALFHGSVGDTPRIFEFRNGPAGLDGTIIGNAGDYSHFSGEATRDSFALSRFDGSFVYLLTGRLVGDTLRGTFHAGQEAQTSFDAVRAQGPSPLKPPTAVTRADTSAPFHFAFRDVNGMLVQSDDPRFRGKVVVVDAFGTWCPTCHEAAPALVQLYRTRQAQGLEMIGLAYEVSGDTAVDAALVRRYRDKFDIPFPLLLAGTNDVDAAAATLPQLTGFSAFPTTIFIGRDGRVRRVHAGFYGPATGAQHQVLIDEFSREVDMLLAEPPPRGPP